MKDDTSASQNGRRMTLREVAKATGASYSTVASYAHRAGWTQNGRLTLLTEPQVTAILEAMKNPVSSGTKSNLASEMQGTETSQSLDFQLALIERQGRPPGNLQEVRLWA